MSSCLRGAIYAVGIGAKPRCFKPKDPGGPELSLYWCTSCQRVENVLNIRKLRAGTSPNIGAEG